MKNEMAFMQILIENKMKQKFLTKAQRTCTRPELPDSRSDSTAEELSQAAMHSIKKINSRQIYPTMRKKDISLVRKRALIARSIRSNDSPFWHNLCKLRQIGFKFESLWHYDLFGIFSPYNLSS